MLDDTTIVMWGEFRRSPRINMGGRDHWPRVMQAFIAGGGMKTGQVIGKTDRYGGEATDRPVHLREVFATLYHNMGINAKNTSIIDPAGRPQYSLTDMIPSANWSAHNVASHVDRRRFQFAFFQFSIFNFQSFSTATRENALKNEN